MAFFKLEAPAKLQKYPFDYHSHFTGILPVQREEKDRHSRPRDHESMAGLLSEQLFQDDDHKRAKGELQLLEYALRFMENQSTNPLSALWHRPNRVEYERAEAAGENIYVAAVILGYRASVSPQLLAAPAQRPELYRAIRDLTLAPALQSRAAPDAELVELARYFNGKVYSSNKYTPFDDCYKMRGAFVKNFCGGDPANYAKWPQGDERRKRYEAWIQAVFRYLDSEGITHTQTAATEDELEVISAQVATYNQKHRGHGYRLLAHTSHQYLGAGKLAEYLQSKILPTLTDPKYEQVVGVDLLGAENKVGNYAELLTFLKDVAEQDEDLTANFGSKGSRARKMVVHIHCGEGSGFGSHNRSMIGNYLYEVGTPNDIEGFYSALRDYILQGYRAAVENESATPRGTRGTRTPFGLFDKLFHDNSLTWQGTTLRRFDISSDRSRELASYNAKRNVMALSETLDSKVPQSPLTWYEWLNSGDKRYALRLGHAYYYRQYFTAKYPNIAFDTNLGSNAITGASGLFGSIEGYRINRGLRHLDGYIDTGVLQTLTDAVAFMSSEALTGEQLTFLTTISNEPGSLAVVLKANKKGFQEQLSKAWEFFGVEAGSGDFELYRDLVMSIAPDAPVGAVRYQVLSRVLNLCQNWRSYLLGADGQGAEHTNIQTEFLRMMILLIYSLLPVGQEQLVRGAIETLQAFLIGIGREYWAATIGDVTLRDEEASHDLELLDGFKAPQSVVTVRRSRIQN